MSEAESSTQKRRVYSLTELLGSEGPDADALPSERPDRQRRLFQLAYAATVYGVAPVLHACHLHAHIGDADSHDFGGFGSFRHSHSLATDSYGLFTVPNTDTAYSSAWLDLRQGAHTVTIPASPDRYLSVNVLDVYGNSTSLNPRWTQGQAATVHVRLARAGRPQDVPLEHGESNEATVIVGTEFCWLLGRTYTDGTPEDLAAMRKVQEGLQVRTREPRWMPALIECWESWPTVDHGDVTTSAVAFFGALNWVLNHVTEPIEDRTLVRQIRSLGLDVPSWRPPNDPGEWAAWQQGYGEAMRHIQSAKPNRFRPVGGSGWRRARVGESDGQLLHRSATAWAGLGGTVQEESVPFLAYEDIHGMTLDGSRASYLVSVSPPPVSGFWSLTAYDATTRRVVEGQVGLRIGATAHDSERWKDVDVIFTSEVGRQPMTNAMHVRIPAGPFYLVWRNYLPNNEVLTGRWMPPDIRPLGGTHVDEI